MFQWENDVISLDLMFRKYIEKARIIFFSRSVTSPQDVNLLDGFLALIIFIGANCQQVMAFFVYGLTLVLVLSLWAPVQGFKRILQETKVRTYIELCNYAFFI